MSIIQSYPKGTPKADDMLLGTVVPKANSDDLPVTRNFSITDVASFSVDNSILKLKEVTITAAQMLALNGGGVIDLIPCRCRTININIKHGNVFRLRWYCI